MSTLLLSLLLLLLLMPDGLCLFVSVVSVFHFLFTSFYSLFFSRPLLVFTFNCFLFVLLFFSSTLFVGVWLPLPLPLLNIATRIAHSLCLYQQLFFHFHSSWMFSILLSLVCLYRFFCAITKYIFSFSFYFFLGSTYSYL